jgi:hypothetical protein
LPASAAEKSPVSIKFFGVVEKYPSELELLLVDDHEMELGTTLKIRQSRPKRIHVHLRLAEKSVTRFRAVITSIKAVVTSFASRPADQ